MHRKISGERRIHRDGAGRQLESDLRFQEGVDMPPPQIFVLVAEKVRADGLTEIRDKCVAMTLDLTVGAADCNDPATPAGLLGTPFHEAPEGECHDPE